MDNTRWSPWQEQFLRAHWQSMTDKEIGRRIGRNEDSVTRKRRKLGLTKNNGRPSGETVRKASFQAPTEYSLAQLPKEERLQFYKSSFNKNWRYKHLKKVLLDDELEYYRHKYIEAIDAMESITYVEEDLLHNMIMCDIQILRLQQQIADELKAFRDESDDDARPPSQFLYKDLSDAESRYLKYQEKLNLTRQQRMKDNRQEEITISSIVNSLIDRRNRAEADRVAGEMSYFNARCKKDMKKMNFLLGED